MNGHGIGGVGQIGTWSSGGGYYTGQEYFNIGIRDMNGGVHHFSFVNGLCVA